MELLVPFLLHLWYDAVLDWGLNPGPPALEASTIPLGYRGGGSYLFICYIFKQLQQPHPLYRVHTRFGSVLLTLFGLYFNQLGTILTRQFTIIHDSL